MANWKQTISEGLNLSEKQNNLYCGTVEGYDVTVLTETNTVVYVNFYGDDSLKSQVAQEFKQAATKGLTNVKITQFGITAMVSGMTYNSIAKAIVNAVKRVVVVLKANNIPGNNICATCGKETENTPSVINGVLTTICNECEEKITEAFELKEAEYMAQPNNYFKGIFGAIIGSLVGVISWIIIYMIGYVAAISAIIGIFLSDFLYVKFGGKSNKMKLVIITIINVIALTLALLGVYSYYGDVLAYEAGSNLSGLSYIFSVDEFKGYFISDLIYNFVFIAVGAIAIIINIYKKNRASHSTITK